MNLGEKEPCVGYLLGDKIDGIAQMFKVIEFARMMVGTKAISTLSTGYQQALAYAKVRVQGPDLPSAADKTSPRVTIIHHPDVRRSLMVQKAYSEGMRALILYTASIQDEIAIGEAEGKDVAALEALNDLLLPIVKGFGSEKSWVLLGTESLQTFGGSGFTEDWPLEQYVRDAKIDTLYEGTTAIQGMDFFFRKIIKNNGQAIGAIGKEVADFCASGGEFKDEKEKLASALGDVNAMLGEMVGFAMESQSNPKAVYKAGFNTTRLLFSVGEIIIAWLLLRQAVIATSKLANAGKDADFYTGKIAAAKYFVRTVLPHLRSELKIIQSEKGELMEVPESAF